MRVLITGGAGFIGSHVADALIARGEEVRVYDSLDPQVHGDHAVPPLHLNEHAEFLNGDVRDPKELSDALDQVDAVIHLGAAVGVGQSMYQIAHYMDVNTVGTARLLELLIERKQNLQKLIVASSMSIYGEGMYNCPKCGPSTPTLRSDQQLKERVWEIVCADCRSVCIPVPTNEQKPLQPNSPYAISKKDQEELCLTIGRAYGIPTVALRFFNVYGARQSLSNPYTGASAIFISRALNTNPPVVFEDGGQSRDFVHVRDIVQAVLLALDSDGANGEMFNVGTGRAISILELASQVCERLAPDLKPQIPGKFRAGDIRHCFADISKIRNALGYKPSVNLEDGLDELIEWSRDQNAIDRFEAAAGELERKGLTR